MLPFWKQLHFHLYSKNLKLIIRFLYYRLNLLQCKWQFCNYISLIKLKSLIKRKDLFERNTLWEWRNNMKFQGLYEHNLKQTIKFYKFVWTYYLLNRRITRYNYCFYLKSVWWNFIFGISVWLLCTHWLFLSITYPMILQLFFNWNYIFSRGKYRTIPR